MRVITHCTKFCCGSFLILLSIELYSTTLLQLCYLLIAYVVHDIAEYFTTRVEFRKRKSLYSFSVRTFTPSDCKLVKTYSYWDADVLNPLTSVLSDLGCNDLSSSMNRSGNKMKNSKSYPMNQLAENE